MSAIGGYFELEFAKGMCWHPGATALNTGRNALEYILRANGVRKLYLPYYTCQVLLQPLRRLGIAHAFYGIDHNFEPLFDCARLQAGDALLYTNYYGLKDDFVRQLSEQVPGLIVDNAQAFYARPPAGGAAFYTARKFFGVPDGAYAYSPRRAEEPLVQDVSHDRCAQLLLRAEGEAEDGYAAFVANEKALDDKPVKAMSRLTRKMLAGIPYGDHALVRRRNYAYLHEALRSRNRLDLPLPVEAVPMVYPFWTEAGDSLRRTLLANRIYVAQYWPEVLQTCTPGSIEHDFAANLIPLPIDQRLTLPDLITIINTITNAH